jgi:hypothetical protein
MMTDRSRVRRILLCAGAATGRMTSAACVQWLSACSPVSASKTHSITLRRSRRTRLNTPLAMTLLSLLVYLQQCAAQGPHLRFVSTSEVSVAPQPGPKRSFEGGTVVRTSDGVHHLFTTDQTYGIVSGSAHATRTHAAHTLRVSLHRSAFVGQSRSCPMSTCVSRCTKHSPEPAQAVVTGCIAAAAAPV